MKKLLSALLVCAMVLTGLAALAEGDLASEQVFTFAGNNDMMTLDSSLANDEMSGLVLYAVNEALIRSQGGQIVPGIAQRWEVSADGLVYTFYLRDAQWSDGVPVTAQDFRYAYLRTMDPATGSSQVEDFQSVKGAADYYGGVTTDPAEVGIEAKDDKTLVITLANADPFFLEAFSRSLSAYPIRKDYVEQFGEQYGAGPESFIGCGPFTLVEWVQTASIKMAKNPSYWHADAITLTEVTELIVGDENTRAGMYDLGEVDALYGITKALTINYPDFKSKETGSTLQYLAFQTSEGKVMANENLRLALSYAINRQAIVNAVCAPGSLAAGRMIIPTYTVDGAAVADTNPVENPIPAEGDLEKAEAYLAAALADMGLTDVTQLPAIRYVAMESATHKAMAEALQAQFQQNLGVKVDIDIRPVPQAIGALLEGDFDIFLVSQSTGVNPSTILGNFTAGNGNNYAKWEDQAYSDLIAAQEAQADLTQKLATLAQAETLLLAHAPVAPLWVPGAAYVSQDYVQGLVFGPWTGGIELQGVSILAH